MRPLASWSKVRPTEPVPLRGWPWSLTGGIGLPVVWLHLAMWEAFFARRVATLFKCCLNAVAMALQRCEGLILFFDHPNTPPARRGLPPQTPPWRGLIEAGAARPRDLLR